MYRERMPRPTGRMLCLVRFKRRPGCRPKPVWTRFGRGSARRPRTACGSWRPARASARHASSSRARSAPACWSARPGTGWWTLAAVHPGRHPPGDDGPLDGAQRQPRAGRLRHAADDAAACWWSPPPARAVPHSPVLPWFALVPAMATLRFRLAVSVGLAGVGGAADPGRSASPSIPAGALDDPVPMIAALVMVANIVGVCTALMCGRARAPRPRRARPAHRPAQPRLARVARGGDRAAGPPHRRGRGARAARPRPLQARQRRVRPRARRRRAARRRLRDPQVAALLRARLPDRRRGVPAAAARGRPGEPASRSPSACGAPSRWPGRASWT